MERQLTFLPVSRAEAASLAGGARLPAPRQAFAATDALFISQGLAPDKEEEGEYAAMVLGSVWGLSHYGERVVLVAELPPDLVSDPEIDDAEADNGAVAVSTVPPDAVVSWFADEPDADTAVRAAAEAAKGLSIDEAWELDPVQALVTGHDLLWHSAEELHVLATREEA